MASFASANGLVDDQNYWHSRMTPVKLVLQTGQTGRAISSNYGAVIEVAGLRLVLPCRTLSMFGTLSVPELSVFPLHVIFVLHLHCNLDAREVVGSFMVRGRFFQLLCPHVPWVCQRGSHVVQVVVI